MSFNENHHQEKHFDPSLLNQKILIHELAKKIHKTKENSKLKAAKRSKYKQFAKGANSLESSKISPPSYYDLTNISQPSSSSQNVTSLKSDTKNNKVF